MTQWQRVYIDVDCIIQSDGVMRPRIIKWPDGRHFIIDKVICRRQAAGVRYDPELAQILARSESIYRQAVAHYNDTLCKPWCRLPGHLLGFDRDTGEDDL